MTKPYYMYSLLNLLVLLFLALSKYECSSFVLKTFYNSMWSPQYYLSRTWVILFPSHFPQKSWCPHLSWNISSPKPKKIGGSDYAQLWQFVHHTRWFEVILHDQIKWVITILWHLAIKCQSVRYITHKGKWCCVDSGSVRPKTIKKQ